MDSISDTMLIQGCVKLVDTLHGENVTVLTGVNAGQTFFAVKEVMGELIIDGLVSKDDRAHRIIRFNNSKPLPQLKPEDTLQIGTSQWVVLDRKEDAYLTTDYEISQLIAGIDS